jgi:predicted DNA binding CopG/RHH family protein
MTKKPTNKLFQALDQEEKALMKSDDEDSWVDSNLYSNQEWKQLAAATLNKGERITIRINSSDLNAIKQKAVDLGIPYQTLIGSTLHGIAVGDIDLALTQKGQD